MISDTKASRDVFNVIELSTLTRWELVPPKRTVEDRRRGISIKKPENLQHALDHYAENQVPIRLGVGLKDGDQWYEFWSLAPINPANSIEEHETFMIAYVQERIIELSTAWDAPIMASTSQVYQFGAKVRNDVFEIWYIPQDWFGENTLPIAYQALPKEASSGIPRTGVSTEPVGECTGGWGGGIGIQSPQERIPTQVPSDDDDEEMTLDQIRWITRFRYSSWNRSSIARSNP
jgi:hypothetical protein